MRLIEADQRTSAWLRWRSAGLGGSDAAAVLGVSPWRSRRALLREKARAMAGLDAGPEKAETWAMRRGRLLEPAVLNWYADFYGVAMAPCCAERSGPFTWVRGSFDGFNRDFRGALEIKVPRGEDHRLALAGGVPDKYAPQLDHLLLVGEGAVDWVHYVSYAPDETPARRYAVVTWQRSGRRDKLRDLLLAERVFWDEVRFAAAELRSGIQENVG